MEWQGKVVQTRLVEVLPTQLKQRDFILYAGEMMRVETVQVDCPDFDRSNRVFCNVLLEDRNGMKRDTRSLSGKFLVHRPTR